MDFIESCQDGYIYLDNVEGTPDYGYMINSCTNAFGLQDLCVHMDVLKASITGTSKYTPTDLFDIFVIIIIQGAPVCSLYSV